MQNTRCQININNTVKQLADIQVQQLKADLLH